ncbi:MAG: ABC transporter ATP-binding protein/permease [Chryseoglobus sp.]|nr:ABC transporter ATP-binding protein/permease [Microcella sp.]
MVLYSIALGILALLDALALALLAVIISPIVTGAELVLPIIGEVDQVGVIGLLGVVCALIVGKSIAAAVLLWFATRRFARYELELGSRLFDSFIASSWTERLKRNSADLVRMTDGSVAVTISSFLLPIAGLLGELLTFIAVIAVLTITQPAVAAVSLVYLGVLAVIMYVWVTRRAREAGRVNVRHSILTSRLITEMVGALKEITLRNKAPEIAAVVRANRVRTTRARANALFLGQMPRYVLEAGLIGGFVVVGITGWFTGGTTGAVSAVALFGLAGFRLAPSIVRFQSMSSQLNVALPHVQAVLGEIRRSDETRGIADDAPTEELPDNPQRITFEAVTFRYGPDSEPAVREVDLEIPFGTTAAFVGSSGAGKSTMIDLLLGLINPTEGTIAIDGTAVSALTRSWRSRVGYVPQEVSLFDASVAQNVALTWSADVDRERVRSALERAQLLETIESRPGGIDAPIGERGLALSGGQRQRLGIARALYADPLVLVMDEATSSLDTATEAAVADAIRDLSGSMTIVSVAHRLSTIMHADRIFFMSGGRVVASGDFESLQAEVPEFAHQVKLAGLGDGTLPA